jgi:hypothetical protein
MSRFVALGQLIPIFPDLMFEFVIFFAIRHNNKIKRLAATICVYALRRVRGIYQFPAEYWPALL